MPGILLGDFHQVKDFFFYILLILYKYYVYIRLLHLIQVEQLSKGIPAILSINNKQDKMLEKQDTTIEILKNVNENTSIIKDEISTSKEDIKEIFY